MKQDTSSQAGRDLLSQIPHAITAEVLRRLDRFDRLLGSAVAPLAPLAVADTAWIFQLARLRWGPLSLGWPETVADVWHAASQTQRESLEACLLRVLDPLAGMVTVPLEHLFAPEEIDAILSHRKDGEVPPVDLRQQPGRAIDYKGYLCVILKVTRLCNLRCHYCHDWSDSPDSHSGFPLLLRAVSQSLQLGRGAVDFILHGGEPLMMGRKGFLRLQALLAHFGLGGQVVRTHLQTNATLIDDWWLDALQLFRIRASVSLDGPPALHDHNRPDVLGRGSYRRVIEGIRRLRERGLLSGVLMVVTESLLDLGPVALHTFLKEHQLMDVCLIPQRPAADQQGGINYITFIDFLISFEAANTAGLRVRVREIEAVRRLQASQASGFCEMAGNCVGAFVSIESDGTVSHCDKYLGSPEFVLGNLWREDLGVMFDGENAARIKQLAYSGLEALRGCPYFNLCQGGCPHERHVSPDSIHRGCCGMAPLFRAISCEDIAA